MTPKTIGKLIGIFILGTVLTACAPDKAESLELSIANDQEEYDIDTDVPVTVVSVPEDADLSDLEYKADSSHIGFADGVLSTGSVEGVYQIYVQSGDIQSNSITIHVVDIAAREAAEKAAAEAEAQRLADEKAAAATTSGGSSPASESTGNGGHSNFTTYNNTEQQNTSASYVLNTNTGKFHYPSCSSVAKIAPQNYSTSNSSRDDLVAQGYSPCGRCKP
ncbi:MAG: hypothetical protein Q4C82_02120 [Eubacteriales bacterium]|nr:hypothetical protein [Eubacteriales bacterium]